jgi:Spy/CpxP family protein refolding chaperone
MNINTSTEKKKPLTPAHMALFAVSLLAVIFTATPYVKAFIAERRAVAQSESGGRAGMGRGGAGNFNPQQMAARRLEQMTEQLQLSTEQRSRIQAIQASFAPRTRAIFDDTTLSREQRREKMRPIRTESDAQIRQVLTAEQQTKYDQMQAQRRAQFGGGRNGGERRGSGGQNGRFGQGGANATTPTNPPAPVTPLAPPSSQP